MCVRVRATWRQTERNKCDKAEGRRQGAHKNVCVFGVCVTRRHRTERTVEEGGKAERMCVCLCVSKWCKD